MLEKTNYDVVKETVENYDKYVGLVAIENSTGGLVNDVHGTTSALDNYRPKICGEYILPIVHCLAWKSEWDKVKQIYSHPQAIRQCRRILDAIPSCEIRETRSTSYAAKLASQNEKIAAICTKLAAEIYGLNNIIEGIQYPKHSITKFIAISAQD